MVRLKEIREEKQLTQKQLANQLGVKQNSISQWETGRSYPSVEILIKLSDLFGCTIDELVKGEKRDEHTIHNCHCRIQKIEEILCEIRAKKKYFLDYEVSEFDKEAREGFQEQIDSLDDACDYLSQVLELLELVK